MIDPNFWQSEDISNLSLFARMLFIGMFSNADDEGRGRANAAFLRSTIFPYDDVAMQQMEEALLQIQEFTSIHFYEIENSKFYAFSNWKKWQRVDKPQKSNIPSPPIPTVDGNSQNDSKNDSENGSKNDSGLKERKGKEKKEKEEESKSSTTFPSSKTPFSLYGKFNNVELTDEQFKTIKDTYQDHIGLINKVSGIIERSPKKDHYKYIITIAEQDGYKNRPKLKEDELEDTESAISEPMPDELREKMNRLGKGLKL